MTSVDTHDVTVVPVIGHVMVNYGKGFKFKLLKFHLCLRKMGKEGGRCAGKDVARALEPDDRRASDGWQCGCLCTGVDYFRDEW